eukprot:1043568-Rhodomonas_salina.1
MLTGARARACPASMSRTSSSLWEQPESFDYARTQPCRSRTCRSARTHHVRGSQTAQCCVRPATPLLH